MQEAAEYRAVVLEAWSYATDSATHHPRSNNMPEAAAAVIFEKVLPPLHEWQNPPALEIALRNEIDEVVAKALVDERDYAEVRDYRWHRGSHGYAATSLQDGEERDEVLMHRLLVGVEKGDPRLVDHINGNKIDNRRKNLRVLLSKAHNAQNQKKRSDAIYSQHRGVGMDPRSGKWRARVRVGGVEKYLGTFDTEDEAARAAREARAKLMPFSKEAYDATLHK